MRQLSYRRKIRCSYSFMKVISMATAILLLAVGCTTTNIDETRQGYTGIEDHESVVVLGRRHKGDYDTEIDFIQCVGSSLEGKSSLDVVPEQEFTDRLYPWFEPRTAPVRIDGLHNLLQQKNISQRIFDMGIRYIIWVDGSTETTGSAGSIACSIGPGGEGCLGFGTWDNESLYEAAIWDFENMTTVGKIKADAKGTSYMPAIVVPIPLLARVKANACKGLSDQLRSFLISE